MKAHVQDVVSLVSQLEQKAQFQRCCYKGDTYWKESQKQVAIRIREEKTLFTEAGFLQAENGPREYGISLQVARDKFLSPTSGRN